MLFVRAVYFLWAVTIIVLVSYLTLIYYSFFKWDVPYAPTYSRGRKMLKMFLELKEGDKIIDLGSGLGSMLLFFSRYPVEVTGVERNKWFCRITRARLFFRWQSKAKVRVINDSFYSICFKQYSVLYAFLFPIDKLASKLQEEMQQGAIFISYKFPFSMPSQCFSKERIGEGGDEIFYVYRKR